MAAPENLMKHRLKRGASLYGLWVGLADPYAAEIAAVAGFDWLVIDGEHAPNDIRSISAQLAVVNGKGPAPIVRLPHDHPALIKQALDIGAQTLLIPMVDTPEQAAQVVRATRYPPEGIRGAGAALARAGGFGATADYLTTANAQICVIAQVETVAAVAAVEDIARVPGVDAVFIGPGDLAADMGYLGRAGHPEVRAAVLDTIRRIVATGCPAGVLATDLAFMHECRAAGATMLGVGIDVLMLSNALRDLVAECNSA